MSHIITKENPELVQIMDKKEDERDMEIKSPDTHSWLESEDIASLPFHSYLKQLLEIPKRSEAQGILDGKNAIQNFSFEKQIRNQIEFLRTFIHSICTSEMVAIETDIETHQGYYDTTKEQLNEQTTFLQQLERKFHFGPQNFSLPLGIFYILVGVIMIASDYPLSYAVTNEGFRTPNEYHGILLCMGIIFSSIYIKIYYDEFIAPEMEKLVTQFHTKNLPEVNIEEIKKAKNIFWIRFTFKTVILIITLGTIIALANYRSEIFERIAGTRYKNKMEESHPSSGSNPLLKETKDKEEENGNTVFVLLSVMFPLIGAISLALGTGKISNHAQRRIGEKKQQKLTKKHNENTSLLNQKKIQKAKIDRYLEWCSSDSSFTDFNTTTATKCYEHGYLIGYMQNNDVKDIYIHAELLRTNDNAQKNIKPN